MLSIAAYPSEALLSRHRRPLCLGLSVGHPLGTTGSIGPFVRTKAGEAGFVSTSFALAPPGAKADDHIHQPGFLDIDIFTGSTRAGLLKRFVRCGAKNAGRVDAAFVAVDPSICGRNAVPEFFPGGGQAVTGVIGPTELAIGDEIAFVGRSSGLATGRVTAVSVQNLNVSIEGGVVLVDGCIEITAFGQQSSLPGDGGALAWRQSDMKAVGMVLAGTVDERDVHRSYLTPIGEILAALSAELL